MQFLFDTDAFVALLNDANPSFARRATRHSPADIAVSSIVSHERCCGAFKSQRSQFNVGCRRLIRASHNPPELDRASGLLVEDRAS